MARLRVKSLDEPDEVVGFSGITEHVVELGDLTVGRVVHEPGFRWSTHVRPRVGGEWCRVRHVGVVISGRLGFTLEDGTTAEVSAGDVYDVPAGHDGYTLGDEPAVVVEWAGLRAFAAPLTAFRDRVLGTLLFTDLIESTSTAVRLGDVGWRELLAGHYHRVRAVLERFGGREVKTTGDGVLALFDAPAIAIRCAATIRDSTVEEGLHLRAGIHVGEVHIVGDDVQGVAVHEAARVMGMAGADEILVSETTRILATAVGMSFEDRGEYDLKGLPGKRRLFVYAGG